MTIVVESDVKIPMRDGTLLDAMVWRPAEPGRYPVLIERSVYEIAWRATPNGEFYARHGYVVVGQTVRGSFASEGEYHPFFDDAWGERQDGYDTVEWAAAQPWSNGQVGMLDGSYSGMTQYMTAPTRPPHLRALFVRQAASDIHGVVYYRGGAHLLAQVAAFLVPSVLVPQLGRRPGLLSDPATRARVEQVATQWMEDLWRLPLKSWPLVEGLADWYQEVLDYPDSGPRWQPINLPSVAHEVDTPILHLTSWYDPLQPGALRAFPAIRARGRTAACREAQRLIVGPWQHGNPALGRSQVGELDCGPEAILDLHDLRLRWYDHWLKGVQNGVMDGPPVRLFLMGTNRWLGCQEWPPAAAARRALHLIGGQASKGGALSFDRPPIGASPDRFEYDPADPVSTLYGPYDDQPVDCRPIEDRVLLYTSEPLTEALHVVGPVTAVLYAASSAPDTDWVVRLCDVHPDGRSILVCEGVLRARYRESLEWQALMQPGRVYRFEVDLRATAQTFLAGHRLRVHVTSSDFPHYDRNLNTGGVFGEESEGQVATNTVFHDALRPSHLALPVMADADLSFVQM